MVVGDVFNIEKRLKEYDDELSLKWSYHTGNYVVLHKGKHVMTVPHGELDARVITKMKQIDPRNGYDIMKDIEETNEKIKQDQQAKVADMAEQFAKDIRKPLIEDAFY
jgi:hypothetical protein